MRSQARKREIDVYDRRLEAISAAAELGSFSRAAAKLRVSTPALVKQVSGFEAEFGITLFERSHSGVKVTPAGALLVDDARSIMRQSEDALRRARRAAGDGGAVRLGVSMMCPGRQTLSMWSGIHDLEPSLRFEIVPVSDLYDERESVMRSLGREAAHEPAGAHDTHYGCRLGGHAPARAPPRQRRHGQSAYRPFGRRRCGRDRCG